MEQNWNKIFIYFEDIRKISLKTKLKMFLVDLIWTPCAYTLPFTIKIDKSPLWFMYDHIMWLSNFFQEVGLWLETLLWHVTVKQLCERTPKHDRSSWQALGSWKVVIQSLTGVCSPTWKHLKVKTNEWGFRFVHFH